MGNILTISIYNYLSGKLVALLSMFLEYFGLEWELPDLRFIKLDFTVNGLK